jgi:NAD-dependent histone deacetylase SIR2
MKTKIVISEPNEAIDPLLSELARRIHTSKRVLVITGAGISCSGGIPVRLGFCFLCYYIQD